MSTSIDSTLLGPREAAALLGVSIRRLRQLARAGRVRVAHAEGSYRLDRRDDVFALARKRAAAAARDGRMKVAR